MARITIKRVYDPPAESDGARVLVDRLWPRGLTKSAASLDHWLKDAAPSHDLRRWYGHDPSKWPEFKRRYTDELTANPGVLDPLLKYLDKGAVTLLYGCKEPTLNNAAALKEYLDAHTASKAKR